MKKYLVLITMSLLSFSCGADSAGNESVRVVKSNGAKQCEPGYTTVRAMKRELTDNGVTVISAACGSDGLDRIGMCGASTPGINIFTIPLTDLEQAKTLEFKPLADLPYAHEVPCGRDEDLSAKNAMEVNIGNFGHTIDSAAYSKVRRVIGNAVARGILDKFTVQGHFTVAVCIEASSSAKPGRFDALVKQLRSIRAKPAIVYSVRSVESCP
jgi:hypothetical protein